MRGRKNVKAGEGWWSRPADRARRSAFHPSAFLLSFILPTGLGKRQFGKKEVDMTMRRFSHPRGALLLVILVLLTMFGLVAVALVVLTQNARRVANVASGIERSSDPPRQLLDDAMRQIVRGSNISPVVSGTPCTGSAIGPHSLLETMYGNLAITGTVTNALATVCGNQMWTFTVGSNVAFPSGFDPNTPLAGRVLTMTSGTAALGQSSVIVGVNLRPPVR